MLHHRRLLFLLWSMNTNRHAWRRGGLVHLSGQRLCLRQPERAEQESRLRAAADSRRTGRRDLPGRAKPHRQGHMSTAGDLDRRRDDRRHSIAMRRARTTQAGAQADDHEQRGNTMLSYGYLAYQAEHAKTQAGQREADAQLGQLSAALAPWFRSLAKPVRALRRQSGTGPQGLRACMPADSVSYLAGLGSRSST